ncbi:MAG: CsgG/HfaB family protein [Deltaproteobacteria bacterium]|nr:CsgG/HfaB family protein [Deltaproteobacteria bacterium]
MYSYLKTYGFPCLLLTFFIFLSCAVQQDVQVKIKNGKKYGVVEGAFRHRWWNYYERGLSFAAGEFWEDAAADLRRAVEQRDADQRMARTYGMHFVDYFPHRELGVAYFHQEKYDQAENELETSLDMVDTGKAKHYLNLVRKKKLELSKADAAPPSIRLEAAALQRASNRFRFEIKGEVDDDFYARRITINDVPEFIELSAKKIPFTREIKLKKGLNAIDIRSADLLGKTTEKTIEVFGDFEGPALQLKNVADGDEVAQATLVLSGALADATGITELRVNDRVIAYDKEKEVDFALNIDLERGENKILLAAADAVGNVTTGELNLTYMPQLANEIRPGRNRFLEACRESPIFLAFSGNTLSSPPAGIMYAAAQSKAAFRLNFKDLTGEQTVYYNTLYVDGTATGTYEIDSVAVNGEPLLIIPGRTVYFNQLLELKEGRNAITIEVTDVKGNIADKTAVVNYRVPNVQQIGSRMSLAVLPFQLKGDAGVASELVYDYLIDAFVDQERFHIVTRGDELEAVLREQRLSQTDLVDKKTAVRVGKLVAAEAVLMGTVLETGDAIEIFARLVNTESSSVLETKDVFGQDKALPQIQYLTNGLALKLKHSFPLIEGMVIKVSGNEIYADFGSFKHIKKEMRFIVFKQGEIIKHPVTGKVLGSDTKELGVATVVSVFQDMSIGKLIADFEVGDIQVQDLVITK